MSDVRPSEVFQVLHGMNAKRAPIFSLLLKRTYDIDSTGALIRSEITQAFRQTDEYYDGGDPDWACVKYEAELVPFKPYTDLVIIGKAYAPQGVAVQEMDVSVWVGNSSKSMRIIGNRKCHYNADHSPTFTEPVPFSDMEIRYERAFGGKDNISDPSTPLIYPRNDLGCGLALKNVREQIEGLALPNLEDPSDLLTPDRIILNDPYRWNSLPIPQGLGWRHRSWYPRSSYVGSMPPYLNPDEVMREEALGLVPKNQVALARQLKLPSYHPYFNNGASIGLLFKSLDGSEPIRLVGLTPEGLLEFSLPGDIPILMLDIGLGENRLHPFLHTVCIRPDDRQVDLIWRGEHPHPGVHWLAQMPRLHAEVH